MMIERKQLDKMSALMKRMKVVKNHFQNGLKQQSLIHY